MIPFRIFLWGHYIIEFLLLQKMIFYIQISHGTNKGFTPLF